MKIINGQNWSFKWQNMGVPGKANYVAMFSAPHVGTNILHSYEGLRDLIADQKHTTVPKKVLIEALHTFLQDQVSGAARA